MHELLQQVRLLDPLAGTDQVVDLLLESGVIRAIALHLSDLPEATVVHDCRGMVAGPGLVDLYSHSGEPGHEERETLESLMQAAIAGGFTRIHLLPDTQPAIDNPATVTWLEERQATIAQKSLAPQPRVGYWAALTKAAQGQQMSEIAELAVAQVVGFADGYPLGNRLLLQRLLEYARPFQKLIALWACDPDLTGNGVVREGNTALLLGLPGIPTTAETTAISTILECVEALGTPVHLMRVSTARGVELIQAAKMRHLPITASTTWMHLLLNSQDLTSYNPNLRLAPPLGNPTDQKALIAGVAAGVIDAIAIDHTPYTYEEKTVAFAEAPAGAIGLELALPLLWQKLVATGELSALTLWNALSTQPARCLHQTPPTLAVDHTAELVLLDLHKSWEVHPALLRSQAHNTPWLYRKIQGQVTKVWVAP